MQEKDSSVGCKTLLHQEELYVGKSCLPSQLVISPGHGHLEAGRQLPHVAAEACLVPTPSSPGLRSRWRRSLAAQWKLEEQAAGLMPLCSCLHIIGKCIDSHNVHPNLAYSARNVQTRWSVTVWNLHLTDVQAQCFPDIQLLLTLIGKAGALGDEQQD